MQLFSDISAEKKVIQRDVKVFNIIAFQLTRTILCKLHFLNSTVIKKPHTHIYFNQAKFL